MKRLATLIIAILAVATLSLAATKSKKVTAAPDFDYPQTVSKTAQADLKAALRSGDGLKTIDALVRYSLAQSMISQDNAQSILSKVNSVIARERRADYRAIMRLLEADIYQQYSYRVSGSRKNAEGQRPSDISEWSKKQFQEKISELTAASIADAFTLGQQPITAYPGVIRCDTAGARLVPTLSDFVLMKAWQYNQSNKDLAAKWVANTSAPSPANLYARLTTGQSAEALYQEYRDSEWCGMALQQLDATKRYADFKDYVSRFPKGYYAPAITNRITRVETKQATVSYPSTANSTDSLQVTLNVENANEVTVNVYRIPDALWQKHRDSWYNYKIKDLTLVQTKIVPVSGKVPFKVDDLPVRLAPLPYGPYIVRTMIKGANRDESLRPLVVTDLKSFNVQKNNGTTSLFVVDSRTGAPVRGVTCKAEKRSLVTDAEGCIQLSDREYNIQLINGKDKYNYTGAWTFKSDPDDDDNVDIFTDLGIYRPGETVQLVAIAYRRGVNSRKALPHISFSLALSDASSQKVDTLRLTTDDYGRAQGSFRLPKDRMNGRWNIWVIDNNLDGDANIQVSEYKAPTFSVEFPKAQDSYARKQDVTVSGTASTYSGMPVANAEATLTLTRQQWWWRWSGIDGYEITDTTVTTDAQGNFTITLPASLFEENKPDNAGKRLWNWYYLKASITNEAGETQEGSTGFTIGSMRGFRFTNENFDVEKSAAVKLPVTFSSNDSTEQRVTASYMLTTLSGKHVHSGTFSSNKPVVDLSKVPSGRYRIEVHLPGDTTTSARATITLWSKTDKAAPIPGRALWMPTASTSVDEHNVGHVIIGTSVPAAHIRYIAFSRTAVVSEGWLTYKPGMHDFKVQLPNEPDAQVSVRFITTYNDTTQSKEVTLISPAKVQKLQVKLNTFRDKLVPGTHERWSLKLVDAQGRPAQGALSLEMFDKALNSLAENYWNFVPQYIGNRVADFSYDYPDYNISSCYVYGKHFKENSPLLPYIYTYDQRFFWLRPTRMFKARGANSANVIMAAAAPAAMQEMAAADVSDVSRELEGSVAGVAVQSVDSRHFAETTSREMKAKPDEGSLRQADVKTALWRPMLTSDKQGNVELEFDVPDFNTTWVMQAIAWNTAMASGDTSCEVLTQKPLMVKSSLPRFVRNGDLATLSATVQNATSEAITATALAEVFDPATGTVFTSQQFPLSLGAKGTQAVSLQWQVPDTIGLAAFRIRATASGNSDGEQVSLPVLPTAQPVIETNPFYLDAGTPSFSLTLPQPKPGTRVTLEYCDNPVWYCVTALPTIYDSNYNIATSLAHALYAQTLAQQIVKTNPQIGPAVRYWKEHNSTDSTLVSMLAKNADLKIGSLKASPFITDAQRQTAQMERLDWLLDSAKMAAEHQKIVKGLQALQNADGGFVWYRYAGCRSSLWTTNVVLELIGELRHLGCLQDEPAIATMSKRALSFYDKEYLRLFQEQTKRRKHDYTGFSSYAYVRSLFPEVALPAANKSMMNKVLGAMTKEWKGLSLGSKAFFALALQRNGKTKVARNIVESIRQFAITKPELGMYWDNLQGGWPFFDKVAVTSTIMMALNEIDPQQQELDQVRKWMLLMKQSNDWGSSSLAADAVSALLSTGSQWLQPSEKPDVRISGQSLATSEGDRILGYFKKTLSPSASQPELTINRTGASPAWGAVYVQTVAPMTSVKAHSITELSITKEYYVVQPDGTLIRTDEFRVGDKVQVHLVIKCNKDMDYVTVADERAACFEPVDQTSSYRWMDRSCFYQETKDSETNLFFDSLLKGTHVVSYEVHVTAPGTYAAGLATAQCQQAPQLTAHTPGQTISVK